MIDKSIMVQYLANTWLIALADGVIHDSERAAIDEICSEIGGKKGDLKKAEKMATAASFVAKPVGRFSDKIRNLEDMIYVSMADGEFGEEEIQKTIPFIGEVGLTQDLVDALVAEGQIRVDAKQMGVVCSSCGAAADGNAKFCPECGAQLIASAPVEVGVPTEFNYPTQGVSVEFAESSSASFEEALAIAQTAPDLQICERSRKQWYLATWTEDQITGVLPLVESLKGLKNRKVYIDGELGQWKEVFGFTKCFHDCQQAYRPVEYCFGVSDDRLNIWGCRQAKMDWRGWAKWLGYGKFVKKDVFEFDKKRIRHELETNLYKVRFCPCVRTELIGTVLDLLPGKVRISDRSGWDYRQEYEKGPNSIKVVKKVVQDGYAYKEEFWSTGITPQGCGVAVEILKKALKACSVIDVDIKMIKSK